MVYGRDPSVEVLKHAAGARLEAWIVRKHIVAVELLQERRPLLPLGKIYGRNESIRASVHCECLGHDIRCNVDGGGTVSALHRLEPWILLPAFVSIDEEVEVGMSFAPQELQTHVQHRQLDVLALSSAGADEQRRGHVPSSGHRSRLVVQQGADKFSIGPISGSAF